MPLTGKTIMAGLLIKGMFRLAEDRRPDAQGAPSRAVQSPLDLYPCLRCLQSGAHAKSGRRSSPAPIISCTIK